MTIRTTLACILTAALAAAASAAPPPTSLIALMGGNAVVSWSYPTHDVIPGIIALDGGSYPSGLATTSTGDLLVSFDPSGTNPNSIRRYSPSGEMLTPFVTGPANPVFRSLAVAPNDDVLVVTSSGGTNPYEVRRFNAAGVYQNTPYVGPNDYLIEDVLVSPDGKGFIIQRPRFSPIVATIQVFDPVTGTLLGSIEMPPGATPGTTFWTRDLELGTDGNIYFLTGTETSIYRVAPTPGAIPFPIALIPDGVSTFTIGPDGLIYAAYNTTIVRYALDGTDMGVFATYQGSSSFTRLHFGNVNTYPTSACSLPK